MKKLEFINLEETESGGAPFSELGETERERRGERIGKEMWESLGYRLCRLSAGPEGAKCSARKPPAPKRGR